jgi:hypothetical protein
MEQQMKLFLDKPTFRTLTIVVQNAYEAESIENALRYGHENGGKWDDQAHYFQDQVLQMLQKALGRPADKTNCTHKRTSTKGMTSGGSWCLDCKEIVT